MVSWKESKGDLWGRLADKASDYLWHYPYSGRPHPLGSASLPTCLHLSLHQPFRYFACFTLLKSYNYNWKTVPQATRCMMPTSGHEITAPRSETWSCASRRVDQMIHPTSKIQSSESKCSMKSMTLSSSPHRYEYSWRYNVRQ